MKVFDGETKVLLIRMHAGGVRKILSCDWKSLGVGAQIFVTSLVGIVSC